jgi:hypothetical protein
MPVKLGRWEETIVDMQWIWTGSGFIWNGFRQRISLAKVSV